jgi:serine/threonine-protein kinase
VSRSASPRSRPPSRLTWRIFFATAAVVSTILAGALILVSFSTQRAADAAIGRGLTQTGRHISALLDGRERALESGALVFARNPRFVDIVLGRQRADLLDQSIEAAKRIDASWTQIISDSGVRLAKSDEPAASVVSLTGSALILRAVAGDVATGAGASADSILFQAVAVPITGGTRQSGVLMAVRTIDSTLALAIEQATSSAIVFYVTDTLGAAHVATSTLPVTPALRAFVQSYARVPTAGALDSAAPRSSNVQLGDTHYVAQGDRLLSAGGDPIGGFIALRSRDAEMAPFSALTVRIVVTGLIGLALAFLLSYLVAHRISRPLWSLVEVAERAAEGDYSARVEVQASDEIGSLQGAVRSMLSELRERSALAEIVGTVANVAATTPVPTPTSEPARWNAELVHGDTISDRYSVIDLLGKGGMGVVYKAVDDKLGEVIALKVLKPDAMSADASALERLKSEIRLARRISHRNVVRTHDFGEAEGLYFITMEYVAGTSLRQLIDQHGRLSVDATLAVGKQLCRALEVAHEQGVIHRDIKPQNMMVQPDGVLKVMDFGVARLAERSSGMTQAGVVVGTLEYMAPEQLLGEDMDSRVDLYAAGVVLYECLTGRAPFASSSPMARVSRLLETVPPAPRELYGDIPEPISQLVLRAMSADRDARPASAAALHSMLATVES